ncbi:hypothetical protein QTP88_010334 [Uroleucon formosanum]
MISISPCQPLASNIPGKSFPKRKQNNIFRSFHDTYYYKMLPDKSTVKRTWVSYSPSIDRVYCIVCKLFGTTNGKTNSLSRERTNDWQHISTRLNEHESSIEHLNSVIRYSMYKNNRVDVNDLRLTSNTKLAENRETAFKAIVATLEDFSESIDRLYSSTANNLLKNITSFSFVTVMFLMNKIFDITTPLLTYLQTPSNDYIQALTMVDIADQRLSKLRTQESVDTILQESKEFSVKNELDEI